MRQKICTFMVGQFFFLQISKKGMPAFVHYKINSKLILCTVIRPKIRLFSKRYLTLNAVKMCWSIRMRALMATSNALAKRVSSEEKLCSMQPPKCSSGTLRCIKTIRQNFIWRLHHRSMNRSSGIPLPTIHVHHTYDVYFAPLAKGKAHRFFFLSQINSL